MSPKDLWTNTDMFYKQIEINRHRDRRVTKAHRQTMRAVADVAKKPFLDEPHGRPSGIISSAILENEES